MGPTLVLVAIHLWRITSSFPKRQADQEIEGRLNRVSSKLRFFCNKTVTLGLMFDCMWCKTIISHPSCSTPFFLSFYLFFAFLAQSQDSAMPGRAWPAMRVISLGKRTVPVLSVAKKLSAPRPSSDSTCRTARAGCWGSMKRTDCRLGAEKLWCCCFFLFSE